MVFERAIVRKPGANCAQGLTHAALGPPDFELLTAQHEAYVATLRSLGLAVEILPALPDYPDAYFVEDVAVITPQVAVITNPGAEARSGEEAFIVETVKKYRPLAFIEPPGKLDGGDVLQVGDQFFIGVSERTNEEGAAQLGRILEKAGYTWTTIAVAGGLHLKSDVSSIGRNTLLINEAMAELKPFAAYEKILVAREEAYAANSLLINDRVLTPKGFAVTKAKLQDAGFDIIEVETSEMQKMDGGLSCLSLRM
jgi:dimethylargininase